ncbi:MAG: DM13 domain-containing protein [Microcystaceae cyanobacterium]
MKKLMGLTTLLALSSLCLHLPISVDAKVETSHQMKSHQVKELPDGGETTILKFGKFQTGEHKTSGTVNLVKAENGRHYIELDKNFKTNSGPDLFVVLHRDTDIIEKTEAPEHSLTRGDYVTISPLLKNKGFQRYILPENMNLDPYQSVAIWCREFNATFGAATLKTAN